MPIEPPEPSGSDFLTEYEKRSADFRAKKAGNLNPPTPPPIPPPVTPDGTAVLDSNTSATNSNGNEPTPHHGSPSVMPSGIPITPKPALPQPGGTDKADASRQSGDKPAAPAKTPPVSTKIVEKSQQGVTTDAKSASPVDLADRSVPSQSENHGVAAAPPVAATKAAKKKPSKSGITIRLDDEDRRRLDELTGGGKSAASVMLEAFRNSAQGSVPAVNHQLRGDLLKLLKILDDLTEQLKAGPKAMKLSPILLAIKDKVFDLHQDLITPKPPDATAQAIDQLVKQVAAMKSQTITFNVSTPIDVQ
jgi:hypothetical protein